MNEDNRRPIATRQSRWAQAAARRLAASRVTPNMISQASIGFAALGLLLFWTASETAGLTRTAALILAAATMQGRLICNLLDGMVAVEGGKRAPTGQFWNEAPDRVADILFLWGAGVAAFSPALGLAAAALAVGTAYLRELGRAEGFAPDFSGPTAKPHRMAALAFCCVLAAILPLSASLTALTITLWIILVGSAVTILRRSRTLLHALAHR